MKKHLPKLRTDKEAEEFIKQDLSDYINKDNFSKSTFEFEPKDTTITFRVSSRLKESLKEISRKRKITYQKALREAMEEYERKYKKMA